MKAHPAAALFPMLPPDELRALADDIKANGQLEPIIVTSENLVLDGRNRLRACELVGVEPDVLMWDREDDDVSAITWVLSKNLKRRHLNPSQIAAVGAKAEPLYAAEAKERQRAAGREKVAPRGATKAAETAAKAVGASTRSVERAKEIQKKAPEVFEQVLAGKTTLGRAAKQLKRAEQLEQVKTYVAPAGKHRVVSVDFSWKYDDALDGPGMDRALPYPPMTVAEIEEFIREKLPSCCDSVCLLACWVTNPIMLDLRTWPVVQDAIEEQGFKPLALTTWRKTEASGQPFTGMGRAVRNDSEQLVLFVRGAVVFNEMGAEHEHPLQRTVFDAPVGENSEKPARAYEMLEHLVPYTSRLELFARKPRTGWVTSGAELPAIEPVQVQPAPPVKPTKKRKLVIREETGT